MSRKILGISAFYHDAAAAIIDGDNVIAAAQEERFTRIKHTEKFPTQAIRFCLEESGFSLEDLDAVVFYDKPLLKFERLLETYFAFAPKGLLSFLKAIPVWLDEKLFLKKKIREGLREVASFDKKKLRLLFSEHHLSHAASAFYTSELEESAILIMDGVGEWCTTSIAYGQGNKIEVLKEINFPHSIGLLYSAFTYFLGFKVNSGEYKLMGLAPYGNPNAKETKQFIQRIKQHIIKINPDGSIWLDQSYFNYATGLRMIKEKKWEDLFGVAKKNEDDAIEQIHCNLALAIQQVVEEIVLLLAEEAKKVTKSSNICLAGGVALNCVANGKLLQTALFESIHIAPASGDAGGALGAAQAVHYMYFKNERNKELVQKSLNNYYLGPYFSDKEVLLMNRKMKATAQYFDDFDQLTNKVAHEISRGNVIGWFQGRMEFGPRALGNRSILADPSNEQMQRKLNLKIKKREGFRPFAPSVLEEDKAQYFDIVTQSPYMLFTAPVKMEIRENVGSNYQQQHWKDRLYLKRSNIQAVTHVDFSARLQTVSETANPKYWQLINRFKEITGLSLLINTSFNVRGEPIVLSPEDAYLCFMNTDMDYLVINNFVYDKKEQNVGIDWTLQFKKD